MSFQQLRERTDQEDRATRTERLCWGSLYADQDVVWIDDKSTPNAEASRLIPKTRLLKEVLGWNLRCAMTLGQRLEALGSVPASIAALAKGRVAFLKGAFFNLQVVVRQGEVNYTRTRVLRGQLDEISQRFFNRPANLGRHFFTNELEVAGTDRWLIRYFTHHGRAGAEVEHEVQLMSPNVMASALRDCLEQLHTGLGLAVPAPYVGPPIKFDPMPLPRTPLNQEVRLDHVGDHKHQQRSFKLMSVSAFSVVEQARRLLLQGKGPSSWDTGLLAHLIAFDGVVEEALLVKAASRPIDHLFELGRSLVLKATEDGEFHPLQAATVLHLHGQPTTVTTEPRDICKELGKWLIQKLPEFHWKKGKDSHRQAFEKLLVCTTHWLTRYVPSALNAATSTRATRSAFNAESCLRLAGDRASTESRRISASAALALPPARPRRSEQHQVVSLVHKWGSSDKDLGGDLSRAGGLAKELEAMAPAATGSVEQAEIEWARYETGLWRTTEALRDKKPPGGIEMSTLSTYFSNLREPLMGISPLENLQEWAGEDWQAFYASVGEAQQAARETAKRRGEKNVEVADKRPALQRFLRALRSSGYHKIPDFLTDTSVSPGHLAAHPACAVWIGDDDQRLIARSIKESLAIRPAQQQIASRCSHF